ncbi:Ral guanine nucleotide dissociation stimulator-like 1 [Labeo rohita]|uniref:Ral guanine nucleotide dissociation stimulator-like 1 n=1 Tax=Labeo rohita TaxID=84645 RepID=A0ABQ8MK83_LABRO|nr:Ral guanine nucleotide dissociation stimulator-like 1 [Labeo rohita]
MPGTSVSEDIEPPNATYDEISELQRKIHLLYGDYSIAHFENSHSAKNIEAIQQLRQENADLNKKQPEAAQTVLEKQVCDKMKKHNAMKHTTQTQRQHLEDLKLMELKPQNSSPLPDTQKGEEEKELRILENSLEKSQLKYHEAEHITRGYRKLKEHLQLDRLETEVYWQAQWLKDLQVMKNNVFLFKDEAKTELQLQEEQVYRERREREKIISRYKKQAEERIEAPRSPTTVGGEEEESISTFEEAFQHAKEATGVTDSQGETQEHLEKMKAENERMLLELKEERNTSKTQFQDVKYSRETEFSSIRQMLHECEHDLQREQEHRDAAKDGLDRLTHSLNTVKAAVQQLSDKLQHIPLMKVPSSHLPLDSEEHMLQLMSETDQKLILLKEELQGKDLATIMKELEEEEMRRTAALMTWRMRASLAVSGEEKGLRARLGRMRHLLCQTGHHVDVQMDEEPGVWLRSFHLLDLEERSEDPVQEWGEEVEDGAVYGVTLHREPIQPPPDAAENSSAFGFMQYRTLKVRRLKAATLERLVTELRGHGHQSGQQCLCEEFSAPSDPAVVRRVSRGPSGLSRSPGSSVALCSSASSPLFQTADKHTCTSAVASATAVENQAAEDTMDRQDIEETGDVLAFPARDIAEQLTLLDAELFVRVVPFHCLGCIWSQRDKKENRNLAPTVRATIAQFNAVTNCVITSLLCPPSTSPPGSPSCTHSSPTHRAKIIEKWISVAQECHQLRNFSSLRAILSALQSNAVYRLKKTWAAINRESMAAFDHLCDTFPDENCVLVNREILVEEGNQAAEVDTHTAPKSPRLSPTSKHMGGLINFEKRRKEFEILSQIRQLQSSCAQYNLHSHPHIISWINSGIPLSDQKSYELSRELEPPVDPCPSSPNLWSHRLITKKLTSLLSGSDNFPKKTFADQISVSSSGSSGSEMEDLGSPNLSPLRYKAQSPSVSCQDISVDTPTTSPTPPGSFRRCLQADLSAVNPDSPSPTSSTSSSSSSPSLKHPMYNKQVADSCIVRVSVEFGNNGNVYKSILITSQDKTAQVIQRALEKHNLEEMNCQDFSLTQLLIPDKANVFYAMCTTANFDFVLRQRYKKLSRAPASSWSPGAVLRSRK